MEATNPMEGAPQPGPQEGRCGAVRERDADGNPIRWCRNWPMKGQTRCRLDGGKAPQNLAAAERRQQAAAGRAYVAKYADPEAHIDWWDGVTLTIDEAYSNLLAMRQLVQSLAPEQLVWGKTEVVEIQGSQFPGVNTTHGAGIHPWVQMYADERDRLHKASVDAGKLNLEDRRVRVSEGVAAQFQAVMKGSLRELDALLQAGRITSVHPDSPEVLRVVSSQLRALEAS